MENSIPDSNSSFYRNLFKIALPVVIQSFIGCSLNMVDTIVVGRLGESAIAAVGIANQYFFLFNLLAMGIASGCGIFISQLWGKRDVKNIRKVLGVSLLLGGAASILFTIVATSAPRQIISMFNSDPTVVELGSKFLKISALSYFFTAMTFGYSISSRSIEKAVGPMMVSAFALLLNTGLNVILVFGKFGLAPLGVTGSAIATLVSRIVETVLMISYVYASKSVLAARIKEMAGVSKEFVSNIIKTVIPVVLNEACWGLGMVVYSMVYGRIGTQAIASVQICSTVQNIFMVITFGLASAATVMIGNKIGAGDEETGKTYARKFAKLGCMVGAFLAIALAASSPKILTLFNVSQRVCHDSLMILYITSLIMVVRVFNIILIVGILRGGGDAKYSLMAEAFTMWFIGIPLSLAGAFLLHLPVYGVAALVTAEEVAKCILGVVRLRSNKWINDVTHDM